MEKWAFVRLVVAVRAVAFQPVRKVMRQQRAVWVILRWGGQEVGDRGLSSVRVWRVVEWVFVGLADDGLELSFMVSFVGIDEAPSAAMVEGSDGCGDSSGFVKADESLSKVIAEYDAEESRFVAIGGWYIDVEDTLLQTRQAMHSALSPTLISCNRVSLHVAHSKYSWMHQTHDREL